MALVKYHNRLKPLTTFDDLFDTAFKTMRDPFSALSTNWGNTNVIEQEKGYHIEVALPGFQKEDVKLEVTEGILHIKAEKNVEGEAADKNYVRREFSTQKFQKSLELSDEFDTEKITAELRDGILHLDVPYQEGKLLKNRTIEIQ